MVVSRLTVCLVPSIAIYVKHPQRIRWCSRKVHKILCALYCYDCISFSGNGHDAFAGSSRCLSHLHFDFCRFSSVVLKEFIQRQINFQTLIILKETVSVLQQSQKGTEWEENNASDRAAMIKMHWSNNNTRRTKSLQHMASNYSTNTSKLICTLRLFVDFFLSF